MGIHVTHQVGTVLEGLLAYGTLIGPLIAVRAVVVLKVGHLAETLVTCLALERFFPSVHALVPCQLRQVAEALGTD